MGKDDSCQITFAIYINYLSMCGTFCLPHFYATYMYCYNTSIVLQCKPSLYSSGPHYHAQVRMQILISNIICMLYREVRDRSLHTRQQHAVNTFVALWKTILYVVLFLAMVPALRPVERPADLFKVNCFIFHQHPNPPRTEEKLL